MFITVVSFKGGVGKTTTAVHLAAYLQRQAPALLIDGDINRSAIQWQKRARPGSEFPFRVVDERAAPKILREFEHVVIDTPARPSREDLAELVKGCDLLLIPTTPDAMGLDALIATVQALRELRAEQYRILLTIVPPRPSRDGELARADLVAAGLPVLDAEIPRLAAMTRAALDGVIVTDVADPRAGRAWDAYSRAFQEFVQVMGAAAAASPAAAAVDPRPVPAR